MESIISISSIISNFRLCSSSHLCEVLYTYTILLKPHKGLQGRYTTIL